MAFAIGGAEYGCRANAELDEKLRPIEGAHHVPHDDRHAQPFPRRPYGQHVHQRGFSGTDHADEVQHSLPGESCRCREVLSALVEHFQLHALQSVVPGGRWKLAPACFFVHPPRGIEQFLEGNVDGLTLLFYLKVVSA